MLSKALSFPCQLLVRRFVWPRGAAQLLSVCLNSKPPSHLYQSPREHLCLAPHTRSFCASSTKDSVVPSAPASSTSIHPLDDVEKWTIDQVAKWAASISPDIFTAEDVQTLKTQRVTGSTLLSLTKQELVDRQGSYQLTGGAAATLMSAIDKLKNKTTPIVFSTDNTDKIIDWFIKNYGQPKKADLEANSEMPLKGRDDVLEQVYNVVHTRYKTKVPTKDNQSLIVIAGAPGIGKTRLMESIGDYLANKDGGGLPKKHLNLTISFGNGTQFHRRLDKDPLLAVAYRLLYRYFVAGSRAKYGSFCTHFQSSFDLSTIRVENCFDIIYRSMVRSSQLEDGQQILVNLGIDEFHQTLDDTVKNDLVIRRAYLTEIIKCISGLLLVNPSSSMFFNIAMAGTILEDLKGVISSSTIKCESIHLRMLNQQEYMDIAKKMIGASSQLPNIRRALMFMGGWPRAMEVFFQVVQAFRQDPSTYTLTEILTLCDTPIGSRYPLSREYAEVYLDLIAYSLSGKQSIDWDSSPRPKSSTFGQLQSKGYFTFTPNNQVYLPPYFMRRILKYGPVEAITSPLSVWTNKIIARMESMTTWNQWERYCSELEICKVYAYSRIQTLYPSSHVITLGDHFGKALFADQDESGASKTKNLQIHLQHANPTLVMPDSRIPPSSGDCSIKQDWIDNGDVVLNSQGGKGALVDLFYFRKLVYGTPIVFLGDGKHTEDGSTNLGKDDLDMSNCKKAAEKMKMEKRFIIVIYSNRIITDTQFKKFKVDAQGCRAIFVCKGLKVAYRDAIVPADSFYFPFTDFVYPISGIGNCAELSQSTIQQPVNPQ